MSYDEESLRLVHEELENCLSTLKEENESCKRQFEDLGINLLPEELRKRIEAIAEFQIAHKIDVVDEISISLGFTDSVLNGFKQMMVNKELKKESRMLSQQKKKLEKCHSALKRDKAMLDKEKKAKEEELLKLKSDNMLLQPKLDKYNEALKKNPIDVDSQNWFSEKVQEIAEFHGKIVKLDEKIDAEKSYLEQFAGLPPSLSGAAKCIQAEKERAAEIDLYIKSNWNKLDT